MFDENISGELPEHIDFIKNRAIPVFESWGYEDSDFFQRLLNIGVNRKNAKGMAGAVHLYHVEEDNHKNDHQLHWVSN